MPNQHIPAPEALELLKLGNKRFVAENAKQLAVITPAAPN